MSEDWYRNTVWNSEVSARFFERLGRSRGSFHKAQYLRIQAHLLEKEGQLEPALELLDELLTHHPEKMELAAAYQCRASAQLKLGLPDEAVESFRAALRAEKEFPNMRTDAALDFAEFAVLEKREDLYSEVSEALLAYGESTPGPLFPVQRFKVLAIGALIEESNGNDAKAVDLAGQALLVASEGHSGFRYHPKLGLVHKGHRGLLDEASRLAAVSGASPRSSTI